MSNNTATTKPVTRTASAEQDPQQRAVLPAVDVFEDASGITLLADMPGVSKGMQQRTPEGLEAIYAEVRVPRYRRSFTLSRELDTTRIEAVLKDGVLNLRIPKQAHAQPRRINVTVG